LLIRYSANRKDPFRILPWAALAIGILCIFFRAISIWVGTPNFDWAYTATHNRMDALFFGVMLGYFYHFRPASLEALMRPTINRVAIAVGSVALLSFSYFFPLQKMNKYFSTFGFTAMYLGCGGVLLLGLYVHGILPKGIAWAAGKIGDVIAYAGVYSYSIYLWHGPTGAWFPGLVRRIIHFPKGDVGAFVVYFLGSFVIGITMSRLIEYPVLHLRDRLFTQPQVVAVSADVTAAAAPYRGA
jgi:peptidoglycan/LPS O-acetylase OafA/YrhL